MDKNVPFYIGRGKVNPNEQGHIAQYFRAYSTHSRNPFWKEIYKKTEIEVEILMESDEINFIHQKEIEFIKLYGRRDLGTGPLANLSDGGDGPTNVSRASTEMAIKSNRDRGVYKRFSEDRSKEIFVYDSNGSFLKSFKHRSHAADFFECYQNQPCVFARKKINHCGFLFSHEKHDNVNPSTFTSFSERPRVIVRMDKNTKEIINKYKSLKEASIDSGFREQTITRSITRGTPAKGYMWSYGSKYDYFKNKLNATV